MNNAEIFFTWLGIPEDKHGVLSGILLAAIIIVGIGGGLAWWQYGWLPRLQK